LVIIDAPPGTSCPVIEAIEGVDFCLLVTEPTPFGLNDLKLAVDMVRELKLPFAVVINRSDLGDDGVQRYCDEESIEVALEIPDDRRIAEAYSKGDMIIDMLPEYRNDFLDLYENISKHSCPR
jgi:MinD superfamily P-loop ATPase